MAEIKPAYLITGDDEGKIDAARRRFRSRAEGEAGPGALELFDAGDGRRAPDAEALIGALAAISLMPGRRYLLVDGAEGWGKGDTERVVAALSSMPPETTIALIAHGKAPAGLTDAVEAAGGELLHYSVPRVRDLPKRLVADAAELGFVLAPDAARMLVERLGPRPLRLRTELERLAIWANEGGRVDADDLEAMIADTSEEAIFSLVDAIVAGDHAATLRIAERLVAQGEPLPKVIYSLAPGLRRGLEAVRRLDAGTPPQQVAAEIKMHPYAAKLLVGRVKGRTSEELAAAVEALADLEVWSRGGSDYPESVALTLALRRACPA